MSLRVKQVKIVIKFFKTKKKNEQNRNQQDLGQSLFERKL